MPHDVLTLEQVFTKTEKAIREAGSLTAFCAQKGLPMSTVSSFRHATRKGVPDDLLKVLDLEIVYRPRRRAVHPPSNQLEKINATENAGG